MADPTYNRFATVGRATDRGYFDEGLRQHMLRVYNYMGAGLILTGLVAALVSSSPAIMMAIFGSRVIKSKALLVSIGVVALLGLFAVAGISGRASGGAAEAGIDESSMGRLYAWGAAWRMALARPLTGVARAARPR